MISGSRSNVNMNCLSPHNLEYTYKDILQVFLDSFIEDFDCRDVEETLRTILSKREVDSILKSKQELQPYRLFWTLKEQSEQKVRQFVEDVLNDVHELNYGFLRNAIKEEYRLPGSNTRRYIEERDSLYNNNQTFAKYNVPRLEPHLRLTQALMELRPAKNVLVDGVLGAGKQWLVLDVCSSYAVQRRMGFKIFWLNVKHCHTPEADLEMLQTLLHLIDPHWGGHDKCDHSWGIGLGIAQRIHRAKTELRRLLKSKPLENCLLVLRNVQNVKTWKAFNLGCKILLTTRNKRVTNYLSPATTKHVPLKDSLTPAEVDSLFTKYLDQLPLHPLPLTTTNPRKLSIIAESIRDGLASWDNWRHVNCDKLTTIIKSSLSVVEPRYREMYEKLFIFPESAYIPVPLLALVWSCKPDEAMLVVNNLHKYSLVEKQMDSQPPSISIPSIYSELKSSVDSQEIVALHQKIVDSYSIQVIFDDSQDLKLPHLDSYFYAHIGHHLMALENENESVILLRKIFLDFRFLEQKIRHDTTPWNASGSILHTLQQIKLYSSRIIDNDPLYERLVLALLDFLPKIEENLIRSEFTCLLQVALMAEERAISEEARRQVQRFPDHLWFTEHGRFHQHRQIINLGTNEVRHSVYLDNDFCLMALNNQELILTDVSLEAATTYLLKDEIDPSEITKMRIFNHQKFLLTLHKNGSLKLWSLCRGNEADNERRRRTSRQTSHHLRSNLAKQTETRSYRQLVNGVVKRPVASNAEQNISAFYLEEETGIGHTSIQLHVAFTNGDICICNWDSFEQEFKSLHTPPIKTEQLRVCCFVKVHIRYYVICTSQGELTVWDLRNSSREQTEFPGYELGTNDTALDMYSYQEEEEQPVTLIITFKHSIWRLKFQQPNRIPSELLYQPDTGFITCSKLSQDQRYLILGTTEGLIVYDLLLSDPVMRSNVSEHIACVDIYKLWDPVYKYIVLCGAQGKNLLHVHTLRSIQDQQITWVHHVNEGQAKELGAGSCLEPNVYLRSLLDMSKDKTQLFAVDSRERIHQIQTAATARRSSMAASWLTLIPANVNPNERITAICSYRNDQIFVGYSNGLILDVNHDQALSQDFITEPIDFLKLVDGRILVASAQSAHKTLIFELNKSDKQLTLHLGLDTMWAYLFEQQFLLLFSEHGVCHINLLKPDDILVEEMDEPLVGFDLKNKHLFLALKDHSIRIFELTLTGTQLCYKKRRSDKVQQVAPISYLAVTEDGAMFALGLENGNIELYTYGEGREGLRLIYSISKAHKQRIRQLRFSPCNRVLISCAEQLCFWNVTHMLNNQLKPESSQGYSSRHRSQYGSQMDAVDAAPFGCVTDVDRDEPSTSSSSLMANPLPTISERRQVTTLWRDKRGSANMPELLACIKFVGNEARQFFPDANFLQFHVIDDEGVYYHLQFLEFNRTLPLNSSLHRLSIHYDDMIHIHSLTDNPLDVEEAKDDEGIDVVGIVKKQSPPDPDPVKPTAI